MLKKVILSSCLLCTNLFTYEIDLKDIDTSKNGIVLGTFFAKNEAYSLINKYPQFDTYVKEIKTSNTPYYVVFALNINKNEHNLIYEIIKKQTKDAFKTSSEVIHDLALETPKKHTRIQTAQIKREKPFVRKGVEKKALDLSVKDNKDFVDQDIIKYTPSNNLIDPNKKAIALGAFNTKEQALSLKEKFPEDEIYIKNVNSKNGSYFVSYCVNIPQEELKANLKRIQQTLPTAYVTSNKRVNELAKFYNKDFSNHIKTSSLEIKQDIKNEKEKIDTLSINTNLPDDNYFDDLFADDYYLDTVKSPSKKETILKEGSVKKDSPSIKSSSFIDTNKKAIAIGTFPNKQKADEFNKKFPNDETFVKKIISKNGAYFVSYSVNIPPEELQSNLNRIKEISPTAYITSNKRVRELAELFNPKESIDLKVEKTENKEIEKTIVKKEKKKNISFSNKEETLTYGNIDISKKAVALGAFFTREDALALKEKFPDDDIYIKNVKSEKSSYFVPYSVNIPKSKLTENLDRLRKTVPSAYVTSNKRVKELAELYNKNSLEEKIVKNESLNSSLNNKDIAINTDLPKTTPEKEELPIKKEEKKAPLYFIEETKTNDYINRTKRSLTIAKTKTLQKAKEIAKTLYKYDVLIKAPVIKNRDYTVYLINIDKENISKIKNEVKKIYPHTFETSRTRISYFYRKQQKSDIFINKNSFIPVKNNLKAIKRENSNITKNKNDYQEAKDLFRDRNYKKALNLFLEISKEHPDDPNLNFYIGRSYYELEDYESASSYFERITIKDDNNLRAKLELAQTYMKLELYNDAVENFNTVLQSEIPNNVKKNIERRLAHIENKQKKHLFGGSFNFNITHDNNSFNVSDTRTFNTLAFEGLEVTDEKYSEVSKTALLNLNHIYKISDRYNIKNRINIMKKLYDKDDQRLNDPTATGIAREEKKELDLLSYALSLSKYSQNDAITGEIDISKTKVASKDYLKTAGLNLTYQRILFRKIRSMLSVKIYNKSYQQHEDMNLDSRNFQFMFGQMLPTDNWGKFNLIYIYANEQKTSPLKNGYDSRTADERMDTLYLTNFYELTDKLSLQTGMMYSITKTKDADSTFDTFGIKRKDTLKSIFTQLQYSYNKDITLTTALKYYDTESNIDIYSYDKMLIDFGFIYSF